MIYSTFRNKINNTYQRKKICLAWQSYRKFFIKLFPFMFAVNAWYIDIVKQCFKAVKRSPLPTFKNLTALSVNDLHSPTIRCSLNVNGLLHK
jgi:hypothetical protein